MSDAPVHAVPSNAEKPAAALALDEALLMVERGHDLPVVMLALVRRGVHPGSAQLIAQALLRAAESQVVRDRALAVVRPSPARLPARRPDPMAEARAADAALRWFAGAAITGLVGAVSLWMLVEAFGYGFGFSAGMDQGMDHALRAVGELLALR